MLAALTEAVLIAQTAAVESTYSKVHPVCPRERRRAKDQTIASARGGSTTKVHIMSDALGRRAVTHLIANNGGRRTA